MKRSEPQEALNRVRNNDITLTELILRDTGNEDLCALAEALKNNNTLRRLSLSDSSIGDIGVAALAKALKHNNTLAILHLNHNNIGDGGAIALAEALKLNKALTRLSLRRNNIGPQGVQALVDALKQNQTLTDLYLNFNPGASNRISLQHWLENTGNSNILYFAPMPGIETHYPKDNLNTALNLVRLIHHKPNNLSELQIDEIKDRIPAIVSILSTLESEMRKPADEIKHHASSEFHSPERESSVEHLFKEMKYGT